MNISLESNDMSLFFKNEKKNLLFKKNIIDLIKIKNKKNMHNCLL